MKKWKTIIMSDLHLGAKQSQTDKILKFLSENESETLIKTLLTHGLAIATCINY